MGFCGQIYNLGELDGHYYYDWDMLDAAIRDYWPEKPGKWWRPCLKNYNPARTRAVFEHETPELLTWFEKYHTPVFIVQQHARHWSKSNVYMHTDSDIKFAIKHDEWDEVLALQDVCFFRQVATYQAFQSIHQYLSGVLGMGQPHVPEISDKDMRDIKGFDEWSFKRLPTKKRK